MKGTKTKKNEKSTNFKRPMGYHEKTQDVHIIVVIEERKGKQECLKN
jgi:hypothetical protein